MFRLDFNENSATSRPSQRRPAILLVEEDESVRALASLVLHRAGYGVLEARSPQEALELWRLHSEQIELLFTDVKMSGMKGTQLAEILLSLKPTLKVLFSSGGYSETVRGMVRALHNAGFLPKPYTVEQLRKTVESAMRNYEPEE
jgi:two-component system cell cycle sensor histidine kinase/response regulator CckA